MNIEAIKIDGVEYVVKKNDECDNLCQACSFYDDPSNNGVCSVCVHLIPSDKYFVRKEKDNAKHNCDN